MNALPKFLIFATVIFTSAILNSAASSKEGKQFLWQTNSYGDDVHIIDVETRKVVKHLVVGPQPHGIAAPDDASVIYIAIENFKGLQRDRVPQTRQGESRLVSRMWTLLRRRLIGKSNDGSIGKYSCNS